MTLIKISTPIKAPAERCFLLSLSIDLIVDSAGERAVAGVRHGLIAEGETVTWRGRHFGMVVSHESLITQYDRPRHFQDSMVSGMFKSFVHDHWFELQQDGTTVMRDELRFAAPMGPLGLILEWVVLRGYMRRLLKTRNRVIRRVAEGSPDLWRVYLGTQPK